MDRRFIFAILLMLVVLVVPSLIKQQAPPRTAADSTRIGQTAQPPPPPASITAAPGSDSTALTLEMPDIRSDTTWVRSALYEYGFSNVGCRLISAKLLRYRSTNPAERD